MIFMLGTCHGKPISLVAACMEKLPSCGDLSVLLAIGGNYYYNVGC